MARSVAILSQLEWLWLLAGLPWVCAWIWMGTRRRQRDWSRLEQPGRPAGLRLWAWGLAALALVLALGRPRWGREPGLDPPPGHDLALVVDVSRSMAAEDQYPDRLGAAIEAGTELIRALANDPGERVAVVAFAGRGVIRCPLTSSLGAALDSLQALRPGGVEPQGTNLSAALNTAARALLGPEDASVPEPAAGRAIVLISDGEQWEGADTLPIVAARLARDGIVVHAVALGASEPGQTIPVATARGGVEPLQFQGRLVLSWRHDAPLEQICRITGGVFLPVGRRQASLARLYYEQIAPTERRSRQGQPSRSAAEQFPLFLAVATALAVWGCWPARPRLEPLAAGLLVGLGSLGANSASLSVGDQQAAGMQAYQEGRFEAALAEFQRALQHVPDDPIALYNTAATLYQLQQFTEAQTFYQRARLRADRTLQPKIDYALGNTAAALQHWSQAIRHYDDCLQAGTDRPELQSIQRNARINRAFVLDRLSESAARDQPDVPEPSSRAPRAEPPEPGATDAQAGALPPSNPAGGSTPAASDDRTRPGRGTASTGGGGGSQTASESRIQADPQAELSRAIERIERARARRTDRVVSPPGQTLTPDW